MGSCPDTDIDPGKLCHCTKAVCIGSEKRVVATPPDLVLFWAMPPSSYFFFQVSTNFALLSGLRDALRESCHNPEFNRMALARVKSCPLIKVGSLNCRIKIVHTWVLQKSISVLKKVKDKSFLTDSR